MGGPGLPHREGGSPMSHRARFFVLALAVLLSVPAALDAEPLAISGRHDVGGLMLTAVDQYDLARTDAVLLLEDARVDLMATGGRRTSVHRIVWIGTELAMDRYADLRVAFDSADSRLEVTALRTWRDDRWWPDETEIAPTAMVETLPFAIRSADDYASIRETMLLHDGVELPCIVETAYTVVEEGEAAQGAPDCMDGLWIFQKDDPAVLTSFTVRVPKGARLSYHSGNEAPEPEVSADAVGSVYSWQMDCVDRLARPLVSDPTVYAPYVVWSTWPSWDALADEIEAGFDEAAVLGEALSETLAARLEHEPIPAAKAAVVVELVNETTRPVRYDDGFWELSPRSAERTWETAYGHRLDRAALAAAMFREAGCEVRPAFLGAGYGEIDAAVPGLSGFDGVWVSVAAPGLDALYNPANGTLTDGCVPMFGRSMWRVGLGGQPELTIGGTESRLELILTLGPGEDGDYSGTGFLRATGWLCPYHEMKGLSDETAVYLSGLAAAVMAGSDVTEHNLTTFERGEIVAGFALTVTPEEPDDQGRIHFVVGDPPGGVVTSMPGGVHIYDDRRGSPVLLPGAVSERIVLRLDPGDRDVRYMPEAASVANGAGRFSLAVERNGRLTVERELAIDLSTVPPDQWPELRALLVEQTHARNRTILLADGDGS